MLIVSDDAVIKNWKSSSYGQDLPSAFSFNLPDHKHHLLDPVHYLELNNIVQDYMRHWLTSDTVQIIYWTLYTTYM